MSRNKRPSPALIVAILALVAAVVVPAFALTKKEKRVVRKIANAQITKRAPGLSVKHAASARRLTCAPPVAGTGQMVKVGSFCIDKYEVSVWSSPRGGTQYGVSSDNYPCSDNGQNCGGIYARSVPGVRPSCCVTYFQAQQALANSGKRLPSNAEWQAAVAGTPASTACNLTTISVANTGANAGCVSRFGAFDMVGNFWEWVADWVPRSTTCGSWSFSDDDQCIAGAATSGEPGALIRGGSWFSGDGAGPFAVFDAEPSGSNSRWGFRGAR